MVKNFVFFVLETVEDNCLTEREDRWIKEYKTLNNSFGFNKREAGSKGKLSEETKEKIGKANKGRKMSEETRIRNSLWHKGRLLSEETKEKISQANIGRTLLNSTREKISKSHLGMKHSPDAIDLMKKVKHRENHPSFGKKRKNASSDFFGVHYNKSRERWVGSITLDGKYIQMGYFKNEVDAAKAYDLYILKNNLSNPINFPNLRKGDYIWERN